MGEPITLYGKDGSPVVVYGKAQAAELLGEGYTAGPPPIAPDLADFGQPPAEGDKAIKVKSPRPRGRTGNL